jgi:hypothetical protein
METIPLSTIVTNIQSLSQTRVTTFQCKEISEKVSQGGRARCPTYEKSMTYVRVGRAPSPAKRIFQRPRKISLTVIKEIKEKGEFFACT